MTSDPSPGPPPPHPGPLEEARALIDALLEERLSPGGAARLERLAIEHKDVRRLYLRYVHLTCSLPPIVAPHDVVLGLGEGDDGASEVRVSDYAEPDPPVSSSTPRPPDPERAQFPRIARHRGLAILIGGLVAACVVLAVVLFRPGSQDSRTTAVVNPANSVAIVTASAAAEWDGDPAPAGTGFVPGQALRLRRGAAELSFRSGTQVLIEGPATFRVIDRNRLKLEQGKLVARVPPPARGFTVDSPTLTVTDLGTEFGLHLAPAGAARVDVFDGEVELLGPVSSPATGPAAATQARATRLTAGQAVTCAGPGATVRPVATNPAGFARNLSQVRVPLPLRGTGAGLKPGDPDPNWSVVSVSRDPTWQPKPAAVFVTSRNLPDPIYARGGGGSQSVAVGVTSGPPVRPKHDPLEGTFTYRATFDLTGFDPSTVSIRIFLMADDGVQSVSLNGRVTRIKVSSQSRSYVNGFQSFILRDGFQPGVNVVDVVVVNAANPPGALDAPNSSWLRVAWEGTAVPIVTR